MICFSIPFHLNIYFLIVIRFPAICFLYLRIYDISNVCLSFFCRIFGSRSPVTHSTFDIQLLEVVIVSQSLFTFTFILAFFYIIVNLNCFFFRMFLYLINIVRRLLVSAICKFFYSLLIGRSPTAWV